VSLPRVLAIVGSGETAPGMVRVHRELFERLGPGDHASTLLDTTYGFQENADDISERIVAYFGISLGRPMSVASYRAADPGGLAEATAVARLDGAAFVLAGPGSPTYALRQWTAGPIADALARKLRDGGVLVMASAAALTLGVVAVPVYEIYKVGDAPTWLDALNLLEPATGLRAAVVPHYDNAEGGNHDTRYCYLGERRLRILEEQLPADTFVLGVDGHTALVLDLDVQRAAVIGIGGVTVRVAGRSRFFPAGTDVLIASLRAAAANLATGSEAEEPADLATEPARLPEERDGVAVLETEAERLPRTFAAALDDGDVSHALEALLALDMDLEARLRSGEDDPALDDARAQYRALLVRLGETAETGARDPHDALAPFVDTLLELRARARDNHDWATADLIRDRLVGAGIEVRDGVTGSEWVLTGTE
jgi:hypothetical protein